MVLSVMDILKSAIVFVLFTTATCAENKKETVVQIARDKHGHHDHDHHDHHMYYGDHYLYKYLLFFAVKLKIIFVIVTIFAVFIVSGKIMALIYYLKTQSKGAVECISESHPEKIVYASPPHHHGYKYIEPSVSHHHKYESHPPPDYHTDESQTQESHEAPPNTYEERYGIAPKYTNKHWSKNTYNPYGLKYSTINPVKLNDQLSIHGGRSARSIDGKINERINKVADFIRRMDIKDEITDTTLNVLKINSISCRKRFVCEAFHLGRSNSLVALVLQLLSNTKLMKYKDNEDVQSLEDCEKKYPNCRLGKVS